MSETDMICVGDPLPRIASVEAGNGRYDVRVTWADGARAGRTDTVDLAPLIFTFKVFKPLRDGTMRFDAVRLGDYGASIVWPGDDDLDIGADAIEELTNEAMTNEDFSAFLKRNKLTLDAAAAHLGIARRLVAYYVKEREIPRYIALACRQLDFMLDKDAAQQGDARASGPPASGRPPGLVYGQVSGDQVVVVHEQENGDAFGLVPAAEAVQKLLSGEWCLMPADREDLRRRLRGPEPESATLDAFRPKPATTLARSG